SLARGKVVPKPLGGMRKVEECRQQVLITLARIPINRLENQTLERSRRIARATKEVVIYLSRDPDRLHLSRASSTPCHRPGLPSSEVTRGPWKSTAARH